MIGTVASLTRICSASAETSEGAPTRVNRLRKSHPSVHFDQAGKGRIVFLPEGAELRLVGSSRLSECFEVMHEDQLYNMFKVDLLGPWSVPCKSTESKSARRKSTQTLAVACA
jgi:hypothetical protein